MKNANLAIQSDAGDTAYHITRMRARAHTHNGGLWNMRHMRHHSADFGGSRAHSYIKKLARTDSAILFFTVILYALYIFLLLSYLSWGVYA